MKKSWIFLVIVVLVIAGSVFWKKQQPEATLEVVSPRTGTIQAYIEEQAKTELPHDYLISMPIAGWLEPILQREGDAVNKDEVIAKLETDDLSDRVHQAEQRIAVLEAQIDETLDHRLERNALIEAEASVKAVDETVRAAEAKLEASKALMEFTQTEIKRLRGLSETQSATDREVRQAEMEYRRAQADYSGDLLELAALKTIAAVSYIGPKFITDYIDRKSFTLKQRQKEMAEAKTQLEIEQRNLQRAEIRSPVEGIVLERHQTRRQYLAAGTPLLTVGRLEELEVIAEVLTERATRIKAGNMVEFIDHAGGKEAFAGKVLRVYPAGFKKISSLGVEQQRVNVAISLDKRPENLGVAYRVNVRIIYEQAENATIVPRTSLFRDESGNWNIMTVENGQTRLNQVKLGLMNDNEAQVLSGLKPSDTIVLRPSREITEGMKVAIKP